MTKPLSKNQSITEEIRLRRLRRPHTMGSFALEGLEFTQEEIDELNMFDEQGWSNEQCIQYLIDKYKK